MMQVGYTTLRLFFSCFALLAGGGAVERPNWAISKPPDGGCGALLPALLL